jgi:hypothetical protein
MAFIDVFADLGLRHQDSTAIDVVALTTGLGAPGRAGQVTREALGTAVGGVISAAIALADPAVVVIGGSSIAYAVGRTPLVLAT